MSIIERVAELLGPIEDDSTSRSRPKSSAPAEVNPIERAFSKDDWRTDSEGTAEDVSLPEFEIQRHQASGTSQLPESTVRDSATTPGINGQIAAGDGAPVRETIKIDRDRLRYQGMVEPESARTPVAECFRLIKSQVLMQVTKPSDGPPANLIMVTSSLEGEGKTFCAINLAISIALERDLSVLLVDGDVASPSVTEALGIDAEQGLMDVLDRRVEMDETLCKLDIGQLTVMPAGTAHKQATELLASDAMRKLLGDMAERYDDRIIIFDSPPLLAASEAGVLANQMGQIVMVVEAGKTSEVDLKAALSRIDTRKVTGSVLNKGRASRPGYGYGSHG